MEYAVTKEEIKTLLDDVILMTVRETITELKKTGFLRKDDKTIYKSIDKQLKAYYGAILSGKTGDSEMKRALTNVMADTYFPVILYYYHDHMTIEQIAEVYDCEVSTITRNKKRLCLLIDDYLF